MRQILCMVTLTICLSGCAGLIIGTAADATIAVAKVPFKVGGAVLDIVAGDDEE